MSQLVGALGLSKIFRLNFLGKRAFICQASIPKAVGIGTILAKDFTILSSILLPGLPTIHK